MPEKARNVESIFHSARQISGESERSAYIENACGGDPLLRQRVEKLLSAEADAGSFLSSDETVAAPSGGRSGHSTSEGSSLPPSEQPGAVLGRYKLLQKIGEGGFGVVYMAQQLEPVQRNVALKIIKLGMDTKDVIARFEQERQALAMMDHPNIARVLDAGATDTGRPYFVMELVKGIPITEYCDRQTLSFRARLDLFIQVCGAVQHAHQKGIIHRDIKPSNVLVTHFDDKAVPKVIDFGIAKATQQKLTEQTMFTHFGQFMGTPAYMSPEQADPLGLDVDTRSDIYSLGVLLYELLTGSTPFEVKTLRAAALDEVRRLIRQQDPPRPSTRLSTLGDDLPDIAKNRGIEPKKLGTILRGDLDWIIMKALEKDRTRRYETATDFARDIERYLNQEPVAAGPPSVSYRLQKFVRRNRTGVAASVIALIGLIGFAATMAVQARRIATERDRANHERALSDRVVEFQARMLRRIRPMKLGESIATDLKWQLQEALKDNIAPETERDTTLASFDSLIGKVSLTDLARNILDLNILAPATEAIQEQFADQPLAEARLQSAMARTYFVLGLPQKSIDRYERALELQRATLGEEHRDTLRTHVGKAMALYDLNRYAEGSEILRRTIKSAEREFGPEDPETLQAKLYLLVSVGEEGPRPGSRKLYEDLLKVQERVLGPDHSDVATSLQNIGAVLLNEQRAEEAAPILERSLKIYVEDGGADSHGALTTSQLLAQAYQKLNRTDEAIRLQMGVLQRFEKIHGLRHAETIRAINNLSDIYKSESRYQEAEPLARKALELNRAALGDSHRRTINAMTDLGIVLGMLGRHHEAEQYHVEAYERAKAKFGPHHSDTLDDLNNLAVHHWYLGRYQKALELFTEYLAGEEKVHGKDNIKTTHALSNLAILYTKLGRLDESQAILDRVLAIRTKSYGLDHAMTLQTRVSLAQVAFQRNEWERAKKLYEEVVAAQKKSLGSDHSLYFESMFNLGLVNEKLGLKEEAAKLMSETLEGRRRVVGPNHSETLDAATSLAGMRHEAGEHDEARKLFQEVIDARRAAALNKAASPAQLNACAGVLLLCPIEELRNAAEAFSYADRAAVATNYADPVYLHTLARAHFDIGEWDKAIEMERKAISLLPDGSPVLAEYQEQLTEYSSGDRS